MIGNSLSAHIYPFKIINNKIVKIMKKYKFPNNFGYDSMNSKNKNN